MYATLHASLAAPGRLKSRTYVYRRCIGPKGSSSRSSAKGSGGRRGSKGRSGGRGAKRRGGWRGAEGRSATEARRCGRRPTAEAEHWWGPETGMVSRATSAFAGLGV